MPWFFFEDLERGKTQRTKIVAKDRRSGDGRQRELFLRELITELADAMDRHVYSAPGWPELIKRAREATLSGC
jgi:hypothetical protein